MLTTDTPTGPALATEVSKAPEGPRQFSFVIYREEGKSVDLHPRLPWLWTDMFHAAWDEVAEAIWIAAHRKNVALPAEDYETCVYLMVACFHHWNMCAAFYHRNEEAMALLQETVDRVLDHGTGAGPVLMGLLTDLCGSPLRPKSPYTRPPLPPKVHAAVRAWVLATAWTMAVRKNVPLAVANCEAVADGIVDAVRMHNTAPKLLNDHPETVALIENWIDHDLDGRAIKHAVLTSARAQGIPDEQFDWSLLNMWIDAAYVRLCARRTAGSIYRWPDLSGGMATAFAELGIPAVDLRQQVQT